MRIEGFDVTYLSSYDGLPVKNHLPVELRERFKTENQWLESGYVLVVGAGGWCSWFGNAPYGCK